MQPATISTRVVEVFPVVSAPASLLISSNSAVTKTIPARGKALVDTQLSIAVPEGTYGRIAPRSGLGALDSLLRGSAVLGGLAIDGHD